MSDHKKEWIEQVSTKLGFANGFPADLKEYAEYLYNDEMTVNGAVEYFERYLNFRQGGKPNQ